MTKLASVIAFGVLSMNASAQVSTTNEEPRHVDAHVHGHGALNFAVEGSEVHLELKMPANDVLGFESITNDKQRHQLHEALEKLEASSLWSMTPAASCKLVSAKANAGAESHDDEHDHHDDHGHHDEHASKDHDDHGHHDEHASKDHNDHGHHDEHASKEHDDHGHHDEHGHEGHEGEGGHMDISATYVFECGNANQLDTISTSLFEVFERSQSLSVQGFTQKGQAAAEMTKNNPEVRF
ncbi:ZrgA family zinc uptake protein [Endozoicomonas arenosclerae]|uniref:ZrgA family zinc uptake protein n=1 Tax=Endozoicomonas arenosclerae TaxID=1633495 RepID=UPI001560D1AC|nr:DUF2796 domain-containing protein [Endozoicomonas arenosclerae]